MCNLDDSGRCVPDAGALALLQLFGCNRREVCTGPCLPSTAHAMNTCHIAFSIKHQCENFLQFAIGNLHHAYCYMNIDNE